ncbi:MAG: substrate-binding domain-containing protein [Opitutales bacterium]|jgi:DNA-binding LacI/PurR family transcriptional regulator
MKTPADRKPVARAVENFEELLRQYSGKRNAALPSENELSRRWELSGSAVNRAAHKLISSGRLRREGYKLYAVAAEGASPSGSRIYVITHKMDRMPGIVEEAAQKGVEVKECYYVGRDAMRHHLQQAIAERVDGVVFRQSDAGWEWDREVAEMDRMNIPCIVAEEAPKGISMVAEDWRNATAQLVELLVRMGHVNIVCVGSLRRKMRSDVICTAFEETCMGAGLNETAKQVHMLTSHTRQGIRSSIQKIRARHPAATALIWFDVDHLRNLLLALHEERITIPQDMSLTLVGDTLDARANHPPITSAAFDTRTHAHLTLDLLCKQIATVRQWGRILQRQRVKIEANIRMGGSILALDAAPPTDHPSQPAQTLNIWPQERSARLRAVEQTWQGSHKLALEARPENYQSLDLRNVVNRSLHRPHGWLGHLPLKNLPPGRKRIHGVDFDLIDERANDGKAVLVMQSSRGGQPGRSPLPSKISLPVNRKVRAVYFLHGCGFVSDPTPFAWYDFMQSGRRVSTVALVPRGIAAPDDPTAQAANIQDWWADFTQFDAKHVRHLVLAENGDPYDYERYLYTYEWENPEPDKPLLNIHIRSNPEEPATLGLLAVTLLE